MKHMETESIFQGPMLLILATYILPFISFIIGLYVLILAIWELRIAEKKRKFTSYAFYGIFLMFVAPIVIFVFIASFII